MNRRWYIGIAATVVTLTLTVWLYGGSARAAKRTPSASLTSHTPDTAGETAVVMEERIASITETPGTVRPKLDAVLSARVMSRVVRIDVREGDTVRAGQPLVWLDSRDLDASVAVAGAGLRSAGAQYETATVAGRMEEATSDARISAARALVAQAEAGMKAAKAKLDMVRTGPRRQERAQASLAAAQAKAAYELAEADARRMRALLAEGAVSEQQSEAARTRRDVARAQYDLAVEAQSMVDEGSRSEDIRASEEALQQAQAGVDQARQALRQAEAARLQVEVRRQDVKAADAHVAQARAALLSARVTRGFAVLHAPFDGVIARRMVDPGGLAAPGVPLVAVEGGPMRLEAVAPESLLRHVRKGARLTVVVDGATNPRAEAVVTEVSPQGDPKSHTFLVRADLPPTMAARTGMFGRAHIVTGTRTALTIPTGAAYERDGLTYVRVADPTGSPRTRLVTLGRPEHGRDVVLSGLAPGERVLTGRYPRATSSR